ncbi:hypothetical protein KR009_006291, partial [Drosophila setifemur]
AKMQRKMLLLLPLLALMHCGTPSHATPIAPATSDGATPIDALVSAAEFGAEDVFDVAESSGSSIASSASASGESTQAEASEAGFKISLLPTPAKTAESVNLEQEAIQSKVLSVYDNSQKKLADLAQPVPILDTISEHEKYGNNGDMFDGISRSIVNGYEAFSNLLNTFIQV